MTPGKIKLLSALAELEDLRRRSTELPADKGREIVELRRLISRQSEQIFSLGAEAFEDSKTLSEFRQECARLRAAVVNHFSAWPIVAIDRNNPAYQASLDQMRDGHRSFATWIRRAASDR